VSAPVNAMAQQYGNASPAEYETFPGTATKDKHVPVKAPASMRVNSESVSSDTDESDLQSEKHDEQRI
jgi:hypothetical protein